MECVKFGHTEEFVCSGSQAGELYIWDLEANKKTRTFLGHKDAIKCMDFHPYGDFLTSGSLDTTIKVKETFFFILDIVCTIFNYNFLHFTWNKTDTISYYP